MFLQRKQRIEKGNKVRKRVKATATTEREIHYKSVAGITGRNIGPSSVSRQRTTAFTQQRRKGRGCLLVHWSQNLWSRIIH